MTRPVLSRRPITGTRARFEADQALLPGLDAAHVSDMPSFAELARRFPFPQSGPSAGDASPAPSPRASIGAGEVTLTLSMKAALLTMRKSDWSEAVLKDLVAFGQADCSGADYRALAGLGLAINKGSLHVLTERGRTVADDVAIVIARDRGMHAITYDFGGAGRAAQCKCVCGHRTFHSRAKPDWIIALRRSARDHLKHVGTPAQEAADAPWRKL